VAETVGFQGGEAECRRGDGVDVVKDNFGVFPATRQVQEFNGIEATYSVTLKADRAALDARVVLKNPQPRTINYEYWTCTTLAPDRTAKNPKTTGGAEIVGADPGATARPTVDQPVAATRAWV